MRLINAERNEDLLKDCPHYTFGDLAAIFTAEVTPGGFVIIKNSLADSLGVSAEELMEDAKANAEPVSVINIVTALGNLGLSNEQLNSSVGLPMYVAVNTSGAFAASELVTQGALKRFAKEEGSFYVLPSSVHELIIVPVKEADEENLRSIVGSVNSDVVSQEEFLSDSVYFYDAKKEKVFLNGEELSLEIAEKKGERQPEEPCDITL